MYDELIEMILSGGRKRCCLCPKDALFTDLCATGTRAFCSEKCWAEYNGQPIHKEGWYGFVKITEHENPHEVKWGDDH